jgi:hypothetical protein
LMAALAVGMIVLLGAAALLGGSGEGYQRVGGSLDAAGEARAALSQLASDLSVARFHRDAPVEASNLPWPSDRIGFLALQAADAQSDSGRIGDLCAVHWYLADIDMGGRSVRCLMRGFRESGETFDALASGGVGGLFGERPRIDEPVAFGVLAYEVRPLRRGRSGAWLDWQPGADTAPEAVDVRLVIARRDLAARLRTAADWNGGGGPGKSPGDPAKAAENPDLEIYQARIRYGSAAK